MANQRPTGMIRKSRAIRPVSAIFRGLPVFGEESASSAFKSAASAVPPPGPIACPETSCGISGDRVSEGLLANPLANRPQIIAGATADETLPPPSPRALRAQERRARILDLARECDTVPTIAARARCSIPSVYRVLHDAGVRTHIRRPKATGRPVEITAADLASVAGMRLREGAEALGCSREGLRVARMRVGAGEVGQHG